jgi:amidase
MEGFVPDIDATVVTRILEAGGEIVGKTTCDNLCFSATGQTPITGPVRNPYDPKRLSGGSSAGSAVALVAGDCDLALGGDQGGSIRLPACWSGCVGHKPTYGLVPYTGCFPLEMSLDHVGPMARSVGDVATLLDVIAGPDDKDFRQGPMPAGAAYREQLSLRLDDLRIGIVQEGFGWEGKSGPEVDETVREAARRFTDLGAVVRDVSIPLHRDGVHIWNVIGIEGTLTTMIQGDCAGRGWKGEYPTELVAFFGEMRRKQGRDLPPMVRYVTLFGQFLSDTYGGRYYAKAQNLARALKAAYDAALCETDILVMPTTPMRAILCTPNQRLAEYAKTTQINIDNAAPFDATGHPSLSVPVAVVGGLPVGMMLAGRSWEDGTVLRAGYAFQQRFAPDFVKPITV